MPTTLIPQPQRVALGTDAQGRPVYITREWAQYLTMSLYQRVGGPSASTPQEIEQDFGINDAVNSSQAHESLDAIAALQNTAGMASLAPPLSGDNHPVIDYVDFAASPPAVQVGRRMFWDSTDDVLRLFHETDAITQSVGHDTFIRAINNTGATITKGSGVVFSGSSGGVISIGLFIANGIISGPFFLGIAAADIPNGTIGKVLDFGRLTSFDTTGAPFGEAWVVGDLIYASPTTAGFLTKVRPTAPAAVVFVGIVVVADATNGALFVRPTTTPRMDYGSFSDSTDQPLAAINTPQGITFNTTLNALGLSIGAPTSRIVASRAGVYNVQFALQLTSGSASTKLAYFWLRKNGVDVSGTTRIMTISGAGTTVVPAWSYTFSMIIGDYFEIMWASPDINLTIDASPAPAFAPSVPSALIQAFQVQL